MSKARDFHQQLQACLGGYERALPQSALPQWRDMGGGQHRFCCGDPRDTGPAGGRFTFKDTGYALAFEVYAEETAEGLSFRSFSLHLTNVGQGTIMFHRDPEAAHWPDHPEAHIQFEAPPDAAQALPFLNWRLPIEQADPIRCLEYLVARAVHAQG
ncbi:MAG: hypothetical protein FJ291_26385 [Planctomycetes bacterium]|nr:hypothetical protein [Planctomycetota bacterium]